MHYEFKIFPIGSGRRRLTDICEICSCAGVELKITAEKDGVIIYSAPILKDREENEAFRLLLIEKMIPVKVVSEYSKL